MLLLLVLLLLLLSIFLLLPFLLLFLLLLRFLLLLVLLQETLLKLCSSLDVPGCYSGFIAGAGGGMCQTLVMGPCTFAVTAIVNGEKGLKISDKFREIVKTQGIRVHLLLMFLLLLLLLIFVLQLLLQHECFFESLVSLP